MRPFTTDGRNESTAAETSEATASAAAGLTIAEPVVVEQTLDQSSLGASAAGTARLAAVLWDMDGTLLDSEKLWAIALEQTAAELGGAISAEARASMVGSNMSNSMGILLADLGLAVTEESVAAAGARVAELTTELFRTDLIWRPGAQEALHAVRAAGVPMALVTSTIRSIGEVALETIGADLFDVAVFGDEVPHNKPHPAPYLQAAEALGVDPADTVAIEDSPVGVASAAAAGATVLAVPCEVPVEPGERRILRSSLVGVDLAFLIGLLAPRQAETRTVE
ncbi:HAD family hydrolase [Actinoalloteichus hymeniacidonis]|uniref:HAD family hydrolase n=1 Tax=Actinoalloteichus hymeniacidonis TaxID=340345 RepID=A0AAC9HQ14_9PSEU|nr:HAD family phosphatase [Actinoalloteichus hymeniacidonis]AOS63457.1 HAD family hydrolase [Actinoalloteichus hymeniacidonis]MBB5908501.1 HAD superfamily hydrolase (TIGR01509 family) [Actinoalloteichus hymeniacidonis]